MKRKRERGKRREKEGRRKKEGEGRREREGGRGKVGEGRREGRKKGVKDKKECLPWRKRCTSAGAVGNPQRKSAAQTELAVRTEAPPPPASRQTDRQGIFHHDLMK